MKNNFQLTTYKYKILKPYTSFCVLVFRSKMLTQVLIIGKYEDVEKKQLVDLGTGNNLDSNSATQQDHQTPGFLKGIDKGLTHIPKQFLWEADHPADENC